MTIHELKITPTYILISAIFIRVQSTGGIKSHFKSFKDLKISMSYKVLIMCQVLRVRYITKRVISCTFKNLVHSYTPLTIVLWHGTILMIQENDSFQTKRSSAFHCTL